MVSALERKWVISFATVFMLVTMLPYVLGYFSQGSDWRYNGLLIAAEDGNSYLAKMLLGASGDWLFRTPYTPFDQSGFLAFFPYILLGKLAAPPAAHEQLIALFHLFRLVGGVTYFYGSYVFMAIYIQDVQLRRFGTLLAAAGGGLGFLSVLGLEPWWGGRLALEFYSPETFGFLSILALPHLAAGRGLMLLGLAKYLRAPQGPNPFKDGLKAGVWWLGLGSMQPLTVVVAWAITGGHLIGGAVLCWLKKLEWNDWKKFALKAIGMGLTSMAIVIYTFISFMVDPFLSGWEKQNIITSPPLTDYLLAYGPALGLAAIGIWSFVKKIDWIRLFPITWIILFPILAYAPYNLQRRLPEGIWTAVICLAMAGLMRSGVRGRRIGQAVISLTYLSALILFLGGVGGVMVPNRPLFLPAGEVRMYDFIAREVPKGSIVMAAYNTSNALPAWAPVRTLIGHGPESIRLEEIRPRVMLAYSGEAEDGTTFAFLEEFAVDFVILGPNESQSDGWDPSKEKFLSQVYNDGEYQIYRVVR